MNSKLIAGARDFFAKLVVEAVLHLDEKETDATMIGVKKEKGGSLEDSVLVRGVAFKKTFSYAGFEQQPKYFLNPKILLLNVELELKAEKDNAKVRVERPEDYQSLVDAEWNIIYRKLEACVAGGVNVVLSRLAIGDLATQYFAGKETFFLVAVLCFLFNLFVLKDRGVFCAGRVTKEDLNRVAKATGAQIQTSVRDIAPTVLGTCGVFEERQVSG